MRLLVAAACVLAVAGVVAGCDLPTDPAPLNPFDPAFDGPREVTPPSDLRVTASSLSAVTLSWTDNSSFETGVRVERAFSGAVYPEYETVAILPADATTYTDPVESDAPRRYRLVAFTDGGQPGTPSAPISLRYRTARVAVDPLVTGTFYEVQVSPDGETVYGDAFSGLAVIRASTGRLIGQYPEAGGIAGFLADGRVAVYVTSDPSAGRIRMYRGAGLESTVVLNSAGCGIYDRPIYVSADGSRAVAACRDRDALVAWRLDAPSAQVVIPFGTAANSEEYVVGISPDGRLAVAGTDRETVAFDLESRTVRWRAPVAAAGAALSPDGRRLLVSGGLANVNVRDAETGAVLAQADGQTLRGRFSGDGSVVAFAVASGPPFYGSAVQLARATDLAPLGRIAGLYPVQVAPTAEGAVGVVSEGHPAASVVRWTFAAGWEVVPE